MESENPSEGQWLSGSDSFSRWKGEWTLEGPGWGCAGAREAGGRSCRKGVQCDPCDPGGGRRAPSPGVAGISARGGWSESEKAGFKLNIKK